MNDRITLKWMNIIREQRLQHKSDEEILKKLFSWGLRQEKEIERRFNKKMKDDKKEAEKGMRETEALGREINKLLYEIDEEWKKMKLEDGETTVPIKLMPLNSSNR